MYVFQHALLDTSKILTLMVSQHVKLVIKLVKLVQALEPLNVLHVGEDTLHLLDSYI